MSIYYHGEAMRIAVVALAKIGLPLRASMTSTFTKSSWPRIPSRTCTSTGRASPWAATVSPRTRAYTCGMARHPPSWVRPEANVGMPDCTVGILEGAHGELAGQHVVVLGAAVLQAYHAEYKEWTPADLPGIRTLIDGRSIVDATQWADMTVRTIGRPLDQAASGDWTGGRER